MSWLKKHYVLVPIDFSAPSFAALAPAKEFVEDISQLHLLHVLPPLSPVDPAARWHTMTDKTREQHMEDALKARLAELGYEGVQIDVVVGNPADSIVKYAKENQADLIVVSSHDEHGLSHFLFGSVTERIAGRASCPVLVVR